MPNDAETRAPASVKRVGLTSTIITGLASAAAVAATGLVAGKTDNPEAAQAAGQAAETVAIALLSVLAGAGTAAFTWLRNRFKDSPKEGPVAKTRTVLLGE